MRSLNVKFNKWIEKRLSSHVNRFEYIYKVEHLTNCALNSNVKGISDEKYCNEEIIVSLTTHGMRFYEVYLAIESIMQQTMKPNKIILWLSDEFKHSNIPLVLQRQQQRGLEIRYYKDILSYKKLIPTLKVFPSASIITVDDDLIYYFDLIENLINSYNNNNKYIYCARMHRMQLYNHNNFKKYKNWIKNYQKFDVSPLNFPTGGAGTLYPPHSFNNEIFNENVFMDICRYADDVWFKAMALLNGVMSKKIHTHNKSGKDFISNDNIQDISLASINVAKEMNDTQLKAVFDKYNLYDKLVI